HGFPRLELTNAESLATTPSPELDPACSPRVQDPVAVAVRRDEPALVSPPDDRDRRRPGATAPAARNREQVRARPGEPCPRERSPDHVHPTPPEALPVRLRGRSHRRSKAAQTPRPPFWAVSALAGCQEPCSVSKRALPRRPEDQHQPERESDPD